MHKDTGLPSRKDFKIITNLPFFFSIAISGLLYDDFLTFHIYIEIERDRLETTSLISMTPKGY